MPAEFRYSLDIVEAKSPAAAAEEASMPTCVIVLHQRQRFRLRVPTNEGDELLLHDEISPKHRTSVRIPIIQPLYMWREAYLPDVLDKLNLEPRLHSYLKPKIVEEAYNLAHRNGGKGFTVVVRVGVYKNELMEQEEIDRIVSRLAAMTGGAGSFPGGLV